MNKMCKLRLLPVFLLASAGIANAATPGAYLGAGVGVSSVQSQQGLEKDKDSSLAGRVFFGYNFNQYFGLETSFSAYDKTRYIAYYYPSFYADYTANALSLVGKAYLPLSDQGPFSLYALLGAAKVNGKLKFVRNAHTLASFSDDGFVPTAGIGAIYDINKSITAGLELSGFGEKDDSDSIGIPSSVMATFSLAYKF